MNDAFLNAIRDDPKEQTPRLVYADWLEEHGGPDAMAKAEFLRLTVEEATQPGSKHRQEARRKRLQQLAATLDTDWLVVVSRIQIENCPRVRQASRTRLPLKELFYFQCDQQWDELQTTDEKNVRFCTRCAKTVHYCDTIVEARNQAELQHCVALDLGVIRREGDMEPHRMSLGQPSVAMLQREEDRMKPDPVSEARERQKRARKTQIAIPDAAEE